MIRDTVSHRHAAARAEPALSPRGDDRRRMLEAGFALPGAFKRLERSCLSCHSMFDSAWAGERICQRCKGTTVWRNGAAAGVTRSGQSQSRSGRKGAS